MDEGGGGYTIKNVSLGFNIGRAYVNTNSYK